MQRSATTSLLGTLALAAACAAPAPEAGGDPAARPDLWNAHLARVEDELSRRTPPGVDLVARQRVIDALRDYRERGVFPLQPDPDGGRKRTFRDPAGHT